jgi:hypothetical protein
VERLVASYGTSEDDDARVAGQTAAAEAIAGLAGVEAALLIVYASVRYDLEALLAGVRDRTGDTPMMGATSTGHLAAGTLTAPGRGVAVLAMTAGPYRFGVASVDGLRSDGADSGRRLARAARDAAGPQRLSHAAVIVLADGLASENQSLLNGIYRVTGTGVPVAGGNAADDTLMQETFVFHDGRVLTDSAVAVWIDTPEPLTVVAAHGWQPCSMPLVVTRVDGPVIHELSGRPAGEVYREHVDVKERFHSSKALGLMQPDGTQLIRAVYIAGDTLVSFAPLPPFSAVQVVTCVPEDLLRVGDDVIARALDGVEPGVLLVFDCAGRAGILKDRCAEETARLQEVAGDVLTFGLYTYGEFARTSGISGYHNATLAVMAL